MMNTEDLNNRRTINNTIDTKKLQDNVTEKRQQNQEIIPEILTNTIYTPAFLKQQIGKLMRIEFLIGTNNMVDRIGILEDVGASYILLRSFERDSLIYADLYSIKFITISATYAGVTNYGHYNNYNGYSNMNASINSKFYQGL